MENVNYGEFNPFVKRLIKSESKNKEPVKEDKEVIVEQKSTEESLKNLGIVFEDDNTKKDILNYSKSVLAFRKLLDEQTNLYSSIAEYQKNDELVVQQVTKLDEKNKEIRSYFESLMSFFTNPPTKEEFELINHSLLLNNVYKSFKDFSDSFENLNMKEQFEANKQIFENSLKQLENFSNTIENKLEITAKKYDDFLTNFITKQTDEINKYNEKSKELSEVYNDSLRKNIKFMKGGTAGLLITNTLLAIVLGIIGVLTYLKYENIQNSQKLYATKRQGGYQFDERSEKELVDKFNSYLSRGTKFTLSAANNKTLDKYPKLKETINQIDKSTNIGIDFVKMQGAVIKNITPIDRDGGVGETKQVNSTTKERKGKTTER